MAVRSNRKVKTGRILLAPGVSKTYQKVATAIAGSQGLTFERLAMDMNSGATDLNELPSSDETPVALVIQQPTFLGTFEQIDTLTDWAHEQGALVIAIINPTSLAVLKAPGNWGVDGADIAIGEGQPLGVPMSSGGPYFGIMACKQKIVRQMPGRIVGRTTDLDGKLGFTLTLQAREQHIRRTKATSNICTNQGLMVTAATIYMSLLGHEGLRRVALTSHGQASRLAEMLSQIDGVEKIFGAPHFHEIALRLDRPTGPVLEALANHNVLGGYDLSQDYPELGNAILICATETKTDEDLQAYASALTAVMQSSQAQSA